jgi:hypothetical protein
MVTTGKPLPTGSSLSLPFTNARVDDKTLRCEGYDATTGIAPDLMEAARGATRGMIDLLSRRHGMAPVDAYMLDQCRNREADTYVGNIRSAVMGGIGSSPAVLDANFKDTIEKFLTPSTTHNSMTKAAFIAIAIHATLHGIKSE